MASRIITAQFELANAAGKTVHDPALHHRVRIFVGGRCEVKGVAVGNTVTHVNVAVAGAKQNHAEKARQSHADSIKVELE